MKSFQNAEGALGGLEPASAATLLATAADVTLIVGNDGVIEDAAIGDADLADAGIERWIGQRLDATVSQDTRNKVLELLADAPAGRPGPWRQVNHAAATTSGPDLPISYAAIRASADGRCILVGRNLSSIASLQQRLIEAQQTLERDYSRIRMAETRYRLLFQTTAEAVLIVDANSEKVLEANPATRELLGESGRGIVGKRLLDCFEGNAEQALANLLSTVRGGGRAGEIRIQPADEQRTLLVGAAMFRQDANPCLLVRISVPEGSGGAASEPGDAAHFLALIEQSMEAFVVTDTETAVVSANPAFANLAQLASPDQARGRALESWLGRPGVDVNVLLSHLRQHGGVRYFETTMRPEIGPPVPVELAATRITGSDAPGYGFTIREIVRAPSAAGGGREVPRSVEQLTELVGRVPLKELVRETTDVIERMCIEAALKLTEDNRASAAEMLGLSRQSLYVKLRRYGLGDLASEVDPDE